jgi:hypothetical protein
LTNRPLHPFPVATRRDVLLFELANSEVMVVGCDSSGGVGPKPLDKIKVDGYILGKFTTRAALMEVLAVGATLVCVVDTLSVEPEPLGSDILRGIRAEAEKAGLDPKLAVTGSTEKNFTVEQTGIGVTVIGTCKRGDLRIGTSLLNDAVVALGVPSVGAEVIQAEKDGKITGVTDVLQLRNLPFVHEIIPVGSTGITHEIETLAHDSKLRFKLAEQEEIDVHKAAGPATVALATLPLSKVDGLKRAASKSVTVVGTLF